MITFEINNPDLDTLENELIRAGFSISSKHFSKNLNDFYFDICFGYNKTYVTIFRRKCSFDSTTHVINFKEHISISKTHVEIDVDSIKAKIDENKTKKKERVKNLNSAIFTTTLLKAYIEGQLNDAKIKFSEVKTFAANRISYTIEVHSEYTQNFISMISFNYKSLKDIGTADLSKLIVSIDESGGTILFEDFIKHVIEFGERKLPEYVPDQKIIEEQTQIIETTQQEITTLYSRINYLKDKNRDAYNKVSKETHKPFYSLIQKLSKKVKR